MWILPNNHPLSSAFAQGYAESNEDLKEYFEKSEPPLLWKSKPLSWKTFLLQWKRVWWLRHLSGRILKPSTRSLFEESLMELLVVTHASRSPLRGTEAERTTQGTSGLSFDDTLRSYNRDGVFSRMLQDTLRSDSMSSSVNWKKWVTSLRQESTQRRKSARLIAENGSLSLPLDLVKWTTPVSDDAGNRSTKYAQGGTALTVQAKQWSTPRVGGMEGYQTRLARGKDAGLLGGGADDRRATELAHSNNNGLNGTENGESLSQRSDRDTSGQNEFQQSERCGSDRTDEELADTGSARDEIRLSGQNEREEGFAGIANNNSTKHRFPAGQGLYQHEWEESRTIESSVEYTVDGYNFTEDLHRAIGNSVVEQTAELAFRDLVRKMHDWFRFING